MNSVLLNSMGLVFGLALVCCSGNARESSPVVLVKTIPVPGSIAAFDHFGFDEEHRRLLLTAKNSGTVEVFDLRTTAHLRTIPGFENPHSILVRPGAATILVTDSGAAKSQLLDASTYGKVRNVPLALGANCLLFDAQKNRAFITAGGDRVHLPNSTLIVVNPNTGDVLKSVSLPSVHLQPMALDPETNRLFVNMADRNSVAVINADNLAMIAEWKIGVAKDNSPIAFDGLHHRLFVVCGDPGLLAVLDSDTGRITNTIPVPADADDVSFAPSSHRLYIPGGDGVLGLYDVHDPDHVKALARIVTQKEARTGLLIPSENRYVLAAPAIGKRGARVMVFEVH